VLVDVAAGCRDGRGDRRGRGLLHWADRPPTHRYATHLVHHRLGGTLGSTIRSRLPRHRGLSPRAIGAPGHARGPRRAGHLAACRAESLMPSVRGHDGLERRALHHVMPPWRGIVPRQTRLAGRPHRRLEVHDLSTFFHGEEGTRRARLARLPATTALAPRTTRTGMRGRIARRWT